MPDDIRSAHRGAPPDWGSAFAALPLERPDRDAWSDIAPRLRARPRSPWPARLAIAAMLALVLIVPLRMLGPIPAGTPHEVATHTAGPADPLDALYIESAQLEGLLDVARDDRVSSATAAEVGVDLDRQLARIDGALAQPGLSRDRQLALWQERVDTLRASVGFESTRRWMVAQGDRYDGALVRVD